MFAVVVLALIVGGFFAIGAGVSGPTFDGVEFGAGVAALIAGLALIVGWVRRQR